MAFRYCSNATYIIIGESVTSIRTQAFSDCSALNEIIWNAKNCPSNGGMPTSQIEFVTIGNQVELLPNLSYSKIASIEIPNSVTQISDRTFAFCDSLSSINIPNSIKTIGNNAFSHCKGLTSIIIPNSVISIGNYAFEYCSRLTSVEIGNNVTEIGNNAFSGCNRLINLNIGNSVNTIGEYAFSYCYNLNNITIPNSVSSIGGRAFYNCNSLTSITIPDPVLIINDSTFMGCTSLQNVVLGDQVTTIDNCAFYNCSSLRSIDIPNSVTIIGHGTFHNCLSLASSITIPNSVTDIGNLAFYGCTSLKTVYFNAENCSRNYSIDGGPFTSSGVETIIFGDRVILIPNCLASNLSNLTNVNFSNSVTSIGSNAFSGTAISDIEIPNSVNNIGYDAFRACNQLNDVYCHISDPSLITMSSYVFSRYPNNYECRTLYVPTGSIEAYQADTKWSQYFGSIVEMTGPSGDVNGDGTISIRDVTALIDYLLGAESGSFSVDNADLNGDGQITIADATALIDMLLSGGN